MKQLLIIIIFLTGLYIFTILTGSTRTIYNGTSLDFFTSGFPAFSYEDATTVAKSLK